MRAAHLIGGVWRDSPEFDVTVDPYRGGVVTEVARGTPDTVEAAVSAAVDGAVVMARMPALKRAQLLHSVADLIHSRADSIGRMMARETGKAISDAIAEVRRSQDTVTLSAEEAIRIEGAHIPLDGSELGAGKLAFMLRFPVGVVGAITPFNAPFNLACHKVAPALAAGDAVVLKPPPQAAGTVHMLAEIFVEAGTPPCALNVVHGDASVGRALASDPRLDFLSFTGSSPIGAEIRANSGLHRVALELGGNGQSIVHKDADVEIAASMCARNAMRLAGQSCISVQSVLVHSSVFAIFRQRIAAEVAQLKTGDPLDPSTDVGTLIDERAAIRVEEWILEAVAGGATLLSGGERVGAQVLPTVLCDVSPEMKVCREEVFGPVVSLISYDDLDEAISLVNSSPYGLQVGIFTSSNASVMRAIREIRAGAVIINGTSTWRTDQLAYGGVKNSGFGREGPRYAIREMTEERLLVLNM